ncbi:iron-containing alcohol dehydrogenase [Salicibibacter cibarius]|uniref:Iron-containing alcohol dehydrogenase n=1 Tax=Salicibibacter cibarius TaxID=2743000 RepID=A0A7T6Z4B7_9BACI|nr:iron-containing alcohol dehydrogenase [Salicibibacter cibarius]QQK76497.1 iron-containing alcohol dehydrogenase [Salicibibacter cibarius]
MNFEFMFPTKVVMEKGIRKRISQYIADLQIEKPLIISDHGISEAGMLHDVIEDLWKNHIRTSIYLDVKPNPKDNDCHHCAHEIDGKGIDGIIALGGGSVIDTAKTVSILATNGGTIKDYEGVNVAEKAPLPLVCIPTTAGTGSEVTSWAVVTDTKQQYKMAIGDERMIPKLALLDAELLDSLPPAIAASTGLDALTHAIEAYTCKAANPISDALALYAITLISDHLSDSIVLENIEHKEQMLVASLVAGAAFGNADTAAVHCLSEAIGGRYDTPHGEANAMFLPFVFDYNKTADIKRHADVARAMGVCIHKSDEEAANRCVAKLFQWNDALNIPRFHEVPQVNEANFADLATRASQNYSNEDNIRSMEPEDYLFILQTAFYDHR